MTVLMAAAAGVLGVLGAWDLLAAADQRAPFRALDRLLAPLRAAGEPSRAERRRLALVGAATLCAAGWLLAGPVLGAVLAASGPLAVSQLLAARRRRRATELVHAAPAVARALADALAGGHSITGAIGAAARGGCAPLDRAAAALRLGEPAEDVLEALRRAARDPGWDALVAATLLQRDAGGDLAALLRDLAERLDESKRAEADARAATAQARMTAWMVAALPAGAAVLAELAAPGYLASLAGSPLTGALVAASAALQLLAILAIRRLT